MRALTLAGLLVLAIAALSLKWWVMDSHFGRSQGQALRRRIDAKRRGSA